MLSIQHMNPTKLVIAATVDESSRCRIWLAESGEELRTLAGKSDEFDYRAGSRWGGHGVHFAGGLLAYAKWRARSCR